MEKWILFTRRGWVALVPFLVYVGKALGLSITDEMLTTFADAAIVFVMSGLAIWSAFRPMPLGTVVTLRRPSSSEPSPTSGDVL